MKEKKAPKKEQNQLLNQVSEYYRDLTPDQYPQSSGYDRHKYSKYFRPKKHPGSRTIQNIENFSQIDGNS